MERKGISYGSTHHLFENTRHSRAARPVARHYVATPLTHLHYYAREGDAQFHPLIMLLIIGFALLSGKRLMTNAVRRFRRSVPIPAGYLKP